MRTFFSVVAFCETLNVNSLCRYENYAVSQFVSVKDHGAKGDGKTDDTSAIQAVFDQVRSGDIILLAYASC